MDDNTTNETMPSSTGKRLPAVTKCCFCISLRTTCLIVGYVNLFLNTMQSLAITTFTLIIGTTGGFEDFTEFVSMTSPGPHPNCKCTYNDFGVRKCTCDQDMFVRRSAADKSFLDRVGIILIFVLLAHLVAWVVNVCCLTAIHKNRPGPIGWYVSIGMLHFSICFTAFLYLFFYGSESLALTCWHAFEVALGAYFYLIFYVYSKQLERERRRNNTNASTDLAYKPYLDP